MWIVRDGKFKSLLPDVLKEYTYCIDLTNMSGNIQLATCLKRYENLSEESYSKEAEVWHPVFRLCSRDSEEIFCEMWRY